MRHALGTVTIYFLGMCSQHRGTTGIQIKVGDWVEILSFPEIQKTLDAEGRLDHLPFMPEMLPYCGRRFRVSKVVQQICIDGAKQVQGESALRAFRGNPVLMLETMRCGGEAHGCCDRGCSIFWKTNWVKPVTAHLPPDVTPSTSQSSEALKHLPTHHASGCYHCQSSEMPKATRHLSLFQRILNCWRDVRVGNHTLLAKCSQLMVWSCWKLHHKLRGTYPRGTANPTPVESLALKPGEWVEVKSLKEIEATLDEKGMNRGLHFSADMRLFCGKRLRVRRRMDGIIVEGTGKFRTLKNSVSLEGAVCDSAYYAFGGCAREDLHYWREIWLRRVDPAVIPDQPKERTLKPAEAAQTLAP